jgi:hypothetical protein
MINGALDFPALIKLERERCMRRGEFPSGARLLKETLALLLTGFRHERDAMDYFYSAVKWAGGHEDEFCCYTPHGDPITGRALLRAIRLAQKYPHYSPF